MRDNTETVCAGWFFDWGFVCVCVCVSHSFLDIYFDIISIFTYHPLSYHHPPSKMTPAALRKQTPAPQPSPSGMFVINRHGEKEAVSFDRILNRLRGLCQRSPPIHHLVDPARVTQAVVNGMFNGIYTHDLDELAAQTSAYMAPQHPDYAKLAARISIDNLHKSTEEDFALVVERLHKYQDKQGRIASMISQDVYEFVIKYKDLLNQEIDYTRDYEYDYFGFKTLERSYLLRVDGRVYERPQHMLLRVCCGIHCGDVERAVRSYHLMSLKYFTHATPTLFNAGTPNPQMSSCFLLTMRNDSIDGIFETLKQCALISKTAGGIGVSVHNIRATNSYIRGTNGRSNGLTPMLRVFNDTARYVDQGGGKRKGSFAVYLEPWHADIIEFLELRKNHGKEELRCRDLFFGLWIPDLFMKRVEKDEKWTLMCPNECPGLQDVWGEKFENLYQKYEKNNQGRKCIPARELWGRIVESQTETGTPYMLYKDKCNRKSNQRNLGTIKSSNLCTEIVEYTSPDEVAVCNLASIALPKYVNAAGEGGMEGRGTPPVFDFEKLKEVTKEITYNLNRVIDRNYYPVPEAANSNFRHRPIGIGVQGLADCFMLMRYPFESQDARELNKQIFETIYFAACESSMELAKKDGPYKTFVGSPASEGLLQMDLWSEELLEEGKPPVQLSGMWNWEKLREDIKTYGMRNSLLLAPMPTASTSQILGNNEAFEAYTSNIYTRRVLSGEFCVVNPHLLRDLIEMGLWSEHTKNLLVAHNGSVQNISVIPSAIKELYKTVWEIKQKCIIDMAADRAPFIDQSQSLNIHLEAPTYAKISAMHFHGWKRGLKTGSYYLRTKAAADAIKFTVDQSMLQQPASETLPQSVSYHGLFPSSVSTTPPPLLIPDTPSTASGSLLPSPSVSSAAPSSEGWSVEEGLQMRAVHVEGRTEVVGDSRITIRSCPLKRKGASNDEHCEMCSG